MNLKAAWFFAGLMMAAVQSAPAWSDVPTLGVNHVGLAVTKLEASASLFTDTLGWRKAGGDPEYPAIFVTDGEAFVTLWQVEDPETATPFDRRRNVGLHHLAMTVESLDALHALHKKLEHLEGVTIEFAPEFLGQGPTTHMMIRDPSGLRLEFIVPASRISKPAE